MGLKVEGLDKVQKEITSLARKMEELDGEHEIKMGDLFTEEFMKKYSSFSSIQEFMASGGFEELDQEGFNALPETELDELVRRSTSFQSWNEMFSSAGQEYFLRKLNEN